MLPIFQGRTILVVEDEALIGALIAEELRDLGGNALVATQLRQATELARTAAIDAAIVDYALKDGKTNGLCATLSLRRIPFVVYSGYGDLVQFPKHAVVILKPAPVRDVLGKLAELLGQSRA